MEGTTGTATSTCFNFEHLFHSPSLYFSRFLVTSQSGNMTRFTENVANIKLISTMRDFDQVDEKDLVAGDDVHSLCKHAWGWCHYTIPPSLVRIIPPSRG